MIVVAIPFLADVRSPIFACEKLELFQRSVAEIGEYISRYETDDVYVHRIWIQCSERAIYPDLVRSQSQRAKVCQEQPELGCQATTMRRVQCAQKHPVDLRLLYVDEGVCRKKRLKCLFCRHTVRFITARGKRTSNRVSMRYLGVGKLGNLL